jgi:pyruvate dehydrogenase E2 component (dihydrolipoamide acetyltransferase)
MAKPVRLPPIATDTTEGTLVRWLVGVGERVEAGQVVAEIDTAKVLFELEAPAAGTVLALAVAAGDEVQVGDTLAWIGEPGEAAPAGKSPSAGEPEAPLAAATAADASARAAPVVRRLAERLGVDLARVSGTGPGGRILREDVERAVSAAGPGPAAAPATRASRLRAATAAATGRSKREVPHFYADLEVDTSAREAEIAEHGFTPVLLACVARRLAEDPVLNATYEEGRGVVCATSVNLGIAVAVEDGILVPVLRDADRLTAAGIRRGLEALVVRAREGRLGVADVEGVTFTVSNAGMTGVDSIVPIVHQPAIAILGVGARALRPVAVGSAVVVRPTVRLVLSCDHRAVDGMAASRWLVDLGRELGGESR